MPDEHTSNAPGHPNQQGVSVANVPQRQRYEINVDGEPAGFTDYLDRDNQRIFHHTEIDEAFAGRGLGRALISGALNDTRAAGMRVVAICPFVAKYVKKHHDFDDILDPVTPAAMSAVDAKSS